MSLSFTPDELCAKAPVVQAQLTHHVFVCTGQSCSQNDSQAVLEAFWTVLAEKQMLYGKRGSLAGSVIVTTCGSVGLCQIGPAVLIYPDGVWYTGVSANDVEEIVTKHIQEKQPVERLRVKQF